MNTLIKKATAALLSLVLIALLIPVVPANGTDAAILYGRNALSQMPNGNNLCKAYDMIFNCIENRENEVILKDLYLSVAELNTVATAYQCDPHPHFWSNSVYSYSYLSYSHVYSFKPNYNSLIGKSDTEFQQNKETFNNAVDDLLDMTGITPDMSDYEKELRIHDTLALNVSYKSSAVNAHNIYGAIVDKECVCQGYTYAFQYLLRLVGIQAHSVYGRSNGGDHSWNLVLIDGNYYYTDVTWDAPASLDDPDPRQNIYYLYFNMTDEQLAKEHTWTEPAYGLPHCTSTEASYYAHNPKLVVSCNSSVEDIASLFRNGSARVYATDTNPDAFGDWYFLNCKEIIRLAGYDMDEIYFPSYSYKGREYHLNIYGTLLEPQVMTGDLDGDGMLSAMDSNILRRIISGKAEATNEQLIGGDLDGSDSLSGIDSNLLKRRIAGN